MPSLYPREVGKKGVPRSLPFLLPSPRRSTISGQVFVCGQGDFGQLGLGDDRFLECKQLTPNEGISKVVDVYAGGMHNLVLTLEGSVYTFGCNDEGALGRDTTVSGSDYLPDIVEIPGKAVMMSAGDSHSACLCDDGRVYAWGSFRDSHGNMGLTLEGNKFSPVELLPSMRFCQIASGQDHLVLLTVTGKVFTVGCGEQGQLGRVSLRSASGEGRRGKTETLRPGEVFLRQSKFDKIWATNFCTFIRDAKTSAIWAFGLNNYQQLISDKPAAIIISPVKTNLFDVREIAGGQKHTLVLKNNGECYAIGCSNYRRLGIGRIEQDVLHLEEIALLSDKKVASISCGPTQSFAITEDGKLYSWGMGTSFQLGSGLEADNWEPQQIEMMKTTKQRAIRSSCGGMHSIFLLADNKSSAEPILPPGRSTRAQSLYIEKIGNETDKIDKGKGTLNSGRTHRKRLQSVVDGDMQRAPKRVQQSHGKKLKEAESSNTDKYAKTNGTVNGKGGAKHGRKK